MHGSPRPISVATMRVRVRVVPPLPVAQFVLPVRADIDSLENVRERIHNVMVRHYGAEVAAEDLVMEVDGFRLLDEFGLEALRDDETVVCVATNECQSCARTAHKATASRAGCHT